MRADGVIHVEPPTLDPEPLRALARGRIFEFSKIFERTKADPRSGPVLDHAAVSPDSKPSSMWTQIPYSRSAPETGAPVTRIVLPAMTSPS